MCSFRLPGAAAASRDRPPSRSGASGVLTVRRRAPLRDGRSAPRFQRLRRTRRRSEPPHRCGQVEARIRPSGVPVDTTAGGMSECSRARALGPSARPDRPVRHRGQRQLRRRADKARADAGIASSSGSVRTGELAARAASPAPSTPRPTLVCSRGHTGDRPEDRRRARGDDPPDQAGLPHKALLGRLSRRTR